MNLSLPPGGILLGLGCDIVEVNRIREVLERHGERFLDRIFTAEERAYCAGKPHPYQHYAARWAAKEAISKTFTTGIGAELGWKSMSIYHGERAEPLVRWLWFAVCRPFWMQCWCHDDGMQWPRSQLFRDPHPDPPSGWIPGSVRAVLNQ